MIKWIAENKKNKNLTMVLDKAVDTIRSLRAELQIKKYDIIQRFDSSSEEGKNLLIHLASNHIFISYLYKLESDILERFKSDHGDNAKILQGMLLMIDGIRSDIKNATITMLIEKATLDEQV
jgi:valyl-tRNA synthetase